MTDARSRSPTTIVVAIAFLCVVGIAAVGSLVEASRIAERRNELAGVPAGARTNELSWASKEAQAFRVFRSLISAEDRFVLMFGKGSDEVLLRLLAHHVFYPAVEVDTAVDANVVVAFGDGVEPPAGVWRKIAVGDAWFGRRTR